VKAKIAYIQGRPTREKAIFLYKKGPKGLGTKKFREECKNEN